MFSSIEKKDIDVASHLLQKFKISTQMLHKIYSKDWHDTIKIVNKELYKQKYSCISDLQGYNFCRLVVTAEGFSLFSGKEKREFRKAILEQLDKANVNELYKLYCKDGTYNDKSYQVKALSESKWCNGKRWAKAFVKATGFPLIFAGFLKALRKFKQSKLLTQNVLKFSLLTFNKN